MHPSLGLFLALTVVDVPTDVPRPVLHPVRPALQQSFTFLDGGVWRSATRGPIPGRGGRPVAVQYIDDATGRSADAAVDDAVILQLAVGTDAHQARAALRALHVELDESLMPRVRLYRARSLRPGEDGLALAARLAPVVLAGGLLDEAFPDLRLVHRLAEFPETAPDDPRYAGQWFYPEIDMPAAWAISTGSPDVEVAIIDNGCDLLHPDYAEKLLPGVDVVDADEDPTFSPDNTSNEHGTACAGLVGALTNNDRDVAGTCPECRLRCVRMLPENELEPVPLGADVQAFSFALEAGVDVISNSWGFRDAIPVPNVLREAITAAQQLGRGGKGAVVVFASGNDARLIANDELLAVEGVLGVGAVGNLGELTQYSNRGPAVDVVAPTGTMSTDISGPDGHDEGDVTGGFGGTSSACPIAAGIAALVLSVDPELTADEVNALFIQHARQSPFATPGADGHDDEYGHGIVRPAVMLGALLQGPPADDAPPPGCSHARAPQKETSPLSGGLVLVGLLVVAFKRRF